MPLYYPYFTPKKPVVCTGLQSVQTSVNLPSSSRPKIGAQVNCSEGIHNITD